MTQHADILQIEEFFQYEGFKCEMLSSIYLTSSAMWGHTKSSSKGPVHMIKPIMFKNFVFIKAIIAIFCIEH